MRRRLPDILIIALLFALPLILFWPQTVGGRTLVPTENLFQYEPFASEREAAGAPPYPHNALVSDLILENYQWKSFIRASLAEGEIPLWNPHQFAGIPFLASGQQSTLYPFSLIYYALPLPAAYGWFTVVQLWLAGVFMMAFARGVGASRSGATLAGIVYQLSAFFVISAVFPMIIAAAAWLPLILLMVENVIRRRPALRDRQSTVPWVVIGAVALGSNILAGHVEITYYTLIITAYYAVIRLAMVWWDQRRAGSVDGQRVVPYLAGRVAWLVVMGALGLALGAVQFIPLFELASHNFRSGSAQLEQVLGWAHPWRDLIQFAMPNFYGSPAHHSYVDIFTGETVLAPLNGNGQPVIDWGIKNYVEGALYVGILPLALSALAAIRGWLFGGTAERRAAILFTPLALLALSFMFGLPTYGLLFYTLPGFDQLHSPFRWIFALTLCVAVLAGFGLDALLAAARDGRTRRVARALGTGLAAAGGLTLAALVLSRLFYGQIEPLMERAVNALAKAPETFTDARMFYSYQFPNILIFGGMALGAGVVFLLASRRTDEGRGGSLRPWQALALALVPLDLMIASWGFNPASDPALLDVTPPSIAWLMQQPGDWRYTTLDDPTRPPLLNPNAGMRYGLDDVRGYESIIPKQYATFMEQIQHQGLLEFNRIAPLYPDANPWTGEQPSSSLLNLLNVRYVITHAGFALADPQWTDEQQAAFERRWRLAYSDEAVDIWENMEVLPRAYTVAEAVFEADAPVIPADSAPATILADTGREVVIATENDRPAWLVVSQSYFPGWRAYIRPEDAAEDAEESATVALVQGNFQGVYLPEAGAWTVRLVYSPQSFQVGAFSTFIGGLVLLLISGIWLWRLYVAPPDEAQSVASRVAKNSIAPIALNLFNRAIDFAFAAIMLRVLGPADSGVYYYAIILFGWFDIFTNFGLNLFLTREVARERSQAWRYLANTSALRLILAGVGVPLLLGFLSVRQQTVTPPLTGEALLAIGLLYVGLVPNSLSTGLSALFYAFERADIPAAITTVATLSKTVFGLAALLAGFGVVGLAAVSILTNLITLAVLSYSGRTVLRQAGGAAPAGLALDRPLMRRMVGESWPLMLNHFLASIFFQIDVVLLEALRGAVVVGQYSVAYKWVLALNIIPAFFTQALLPVMSREAREDRAGLRQRYIAAIRLLVSLALPLAVLFTFLAEPLTRLLGGAEYLPDGAIALQLMIWSIPIGWMNSLTQYVLIALDLQRRITGAFVIGVAFNILTNLIFIPTYGYRAAAITTIASEMVLLIPFALLLRRGIGSIPWAAILWRPAVAAGAMLAILAVGWNEQPFLSLMLACVAYPLLWLALHPADAAEHLARLRGRLPVASGR